MKNTSEHILVSSTSLLGFCFVVITAFHPNSSYKTSIIDDVTCLASIILILSCIFSFISIRSQNEKRTQQFETIADYLFFAALLVILIIILGTSLSLFASP
jgi:fumarate reductase subunit C